MVEDPIIRTCKPWHAAFAASALILFGSAAEASVDERALLEAYAKARAAGSLGEYEEAARSYAAALALAPDNEALAARALSQAIAAGNQALGLRAARILEAKNQLAPDARLLLLTEALRTKDWKAANLHIAAIGKDEVFAFMTPVLRAWVAHGSKRGDPLAIIAQASADQLSAGYAAEHRPLLLIARGKSEQGANELLAILGNSGGRSLRLRLAGAATLAEQGKRTQAMRLLEGQAPPLVSARALLADGKPIPGAIATAPQGVAEFLVRIASDLHAQKVDALALSFARLASFLGPDNSETWIAVSQLLAAKNQHDEALAVLAMVQPRDPMAAGIADLRIRLLLASGKKEAALREAEAAASGPGAGVADLTGLGDLYSELKRPADAARSYRAALELLKQGKPGPSEWTLWLQTGGALEQAGNWPEAKAALQNAYKLAPEQPLVLNYLGYAQLERRENIEEAMALITKASTLQPDSAEITDSLGWAHYLRGNVPTAIELLEKAVSARPADVEINEHLGDAYYAAGRRYEARYAWQAALLHAEGEDAARLSAKVQTGLTPKLASP